MNWKPVEAGAGAVSVEAIDGGMKPPVVAGAAAGALLNTKPPTTGVYNSKVSGYKTNLTAPYVKSARESGKFGYGFDLLLGYWSGDFLGNFREHLISFTVISINSQIHEWRNDYFRMNWIKFIYFKSFK